MSTECSSSSPRVECEINGKSAIRRLKKQLKNCSHRSCSGCSSLGLGRRGIICSIRTLSVFCATRPRSANACYAGSRISPVGRTPKASRRISAFSRRALASLRSAAQSTTTKAGWLMRQALKETSSTSGGPPSGQSSIGYMSTADTDSVAFGQVNAILLLRLWRVVSYAFTAAVELRSSCCELFCRRKNGRGGIAGHFDLWPHSRRNSFPNSNTPVVRL